MFDSYLQAFISLDIHKKLGLSFHEFMDQPREYVRAMIRACEDMAKKENRIHEENIEKLNKVNKS
jgi:hypothetical protein